MGAIRSFVPLGLVLIAGGLTLHAFQAPQAPSQESQATKVAPAEQGKHLFEQNCAVCHGIDASGGDGPDIQEVPANLGDQAVQGIIRRGVPGTAMPAFFNLNQTDAASIVAYIRKLGSSAGAGTIKGDPNEGEKIFQSSGCMTCHMIAGTGGEIGPDLTRIGSMRGPSNLRARLEDPGANLPKEGSVADRGKWTLYLMFRAVPKDGRPVEGIRVGEDSFTIVLKDASGTFHEFWKPNLRSLEMEPGKSFMPSFKGTLSATQLDDLVAYLTSLKGVRP